MSQNQPGGGKRIPVPLGDEMTPEQRISRMLEIIDDLEPLVALPQEEFRVEDRREEAAAYAAALGRCASKLPPEFITAHSEIDWKILEDLRYTGFHDVIDVLILHDLLENALPALKEKLERVLAAR